MKEKINEDTILQKLTKEIKERIDVLNHNYDYIEQELIEYYIYELKALNLRYSYLLKQLKCEKVAK